MSWKIQRDDGNDGIRFSGREKCQRHDKGHEMQEDPRQEDEVE